MSANFTPTLHSYSDQSPFRYWVQKVLPLVYDDSLSYYELLNKMVVFLNNVIDTANDLTADMTALYTAYGQLQDYVNEYFENLDVSAEVDRKLDEMVLDGTIPLIINTYLGDHIGAYVTAWLNEHPEATTTVQDGSITNAKLVQSGGILSDVEVLNTILLPFSTPNLLWNSEQYPDSIYIQDHPLIDPVLSPTQRIILPMNYNESFIQLPVPFTGGFFIFDTMVQKRSGNNITTGDVVARLKKVHESSGSLVTDMTINAEETGYLPSSYRWNGDEYREHWTWVFEIPSSSNWVGEMNHWVVEFEFSNMENSESGLNNLYIEFNNPWLVSYTGTQLSYALDYVHSEYTETMTISNTLARMQKQFNDLQNTVGTLQLDAMPQLSSSDIATIIGNVN